MLYFLSDYIYNKSHIMGIKYKEYIIIEHDLSETDKFYGILKYFVNATLLCEMLYIRGQIYGLIKYFNNGSMKYMKFDNTSHQDQPINFNKCTIMIHDEKGNTVYQNTYIVTN